MAGVELEGRRARRHHVLSALRAEQRVVCPRTHAHTRVSAGYQWDYVFDWTILKHQQSASRSRPLSQPEGAAGGLPAEQGGALQAAEEDPNRAAATADSQRRRFEF